MRVTSRHRHVLPSRYGREKTIPPYHSDAFAALREILPENPKIVLKRSTHLHGLLCTIIPDVP